jgi:flagellar hook-basal body complex protein FliE
MSLPISPITLPSLISPPASSSTNASIQGNSFHNALTAAIQNVEQSQAKADTAVSSYLSGANQELHSTILATQNADLNFEMFLQVRNKVVSAYEEIMRMQV